MTQKPEATPRPWGIDRDGDIAGPGGGLVACPDFGIGEADAVIGRANAELIVRAVNSHDALVGALEAALAIIERDADYALPDSAAAHDQAVTALAQARGEAGGDDS